MLHSIVMAGGSGTRFWPLSRRERPKQLLPIVGDEALLRQTWRRLADMPECAGVRIATRRDLVRPIAECLPEIGAEGCIVEPEPRDTAPCVALACAHVLADDGPEARMAFVPADQWISPASRLQESLRVAAETAVQRSRLVVLGVRPTRPETGYGYIRSEDPDRESDGLRIAQVASFVEKPDRERAEEFLANGSYLWNSGIFVWQLEALLREFEIHAPEFADGIRSMAEHVRAGDMAARDAAFLALPKTSLDYALLEKTDSVDVVHVDFDWDDVGGFESLSQYLEPDPEDNRLRSQGATRVALHGSRANLVVTEGEARRLVALVGCEDLVVIDSGDATLICPRSELGRLKELVQDLDARGLGSWA